MLFVGDSRGIGNISLFFTVCSAVLLAVRILIGRFSDKGSLTVFVNCALVFTAVSMFSVGMAKSLLPIICAAVFKALGQGSGILPCRAKRVKRAEKNRVVRQHGTMYIGNDIGNTLGPIIGGLISQFAGYAAVFYDSMILVGVAMLAFNLYQKKIGYQRSNVDA
jgi:predicted MFS family arabinose efflux permease